MKLTDKQKKNVDILQWVLIVVLFIVCIFGTIFNSSKNKDDFEYQKEQTYVKIYESQNLESLKKENKELHDSIIKLSNVESAVEIKYLYKYITDTIKSNEFEYTETDSIYHYEQNNDTIALEIEVKAKELDWVKNKFTVNDKFMIINREKDGTNQTIIHHNPNVEIDEVNTYHRLNTKNKWYNNFHFGVQVGAGYGLINNKPDIYIGVGVSYTIK